MGTSEFCDDRPLFTYYDREYRLHFIWDGMKNNNFAISQGGIGEPVVASLAHTVSTERRHPLDILKDFERHCLIFKAKVSRTFDEHPNLSPSRDDDVVMAIYTTVKKEN